jgi:hypothetical protein
MTKRSLHSVADIIDAFGGTKKTAKWAGTGMSTISNWLAHDHIPKGWHYRIHLELTARGFDVDPLAFGMRAFEQRAAKECRAPTLGEAA